MATAGPTDVVTANQVRSTRELETPNARVLAIGRRNARMHDRPHDLRFTQNVYKDGVGRELWTGHPTRSAHSRRTKLSHRPCASVHATPLYE
jgi:hypothetical protein